MQTPQLILGLDDELIVDEFACGGGKWGPLIAKRCAKTRRVVGARPRPRRADSTQVRMCGNAVPPPLGRAVIEANWHSRVALRRVA